MNEQDFRAAVADIAAKAAQVGQAGQMTETKTALQSTTVWGGIAAILAGLGNLALVLAALATPDTVIPSLVGIWGGGLAIWGRLRATQRIA